jgi:putative holliday junction resolvase
MGCWLGVDHGSRRIGIAVGNEVDGLAVGVTVLAASPIDHLAGQIAALLQEYGCGGIVVGWPLNMDDTEGPQGVAARQFAAELARRIDTDVRLWDERLSSFQADRALAGSMTRAKRRRRQDAVAAAAFLGDFLAGDGPNTAPQPEQATPPDES